LENSIFNYFNLHLGLIFEHILKAHDMKPQITQIQPNLIISRAPKREMRTRVFPNNKIHGKKALFSSLFLVPFKSCNATSSNLYDASYYQLSENVRKFILKH
jgi:hypothetical protein